MKIRTKLILMAVTSQVLMIFAIAVYFIILTPINQLESENLYFQSAARGANKLQAELNKLATLGINTQIKEFEVAYDNYKNAVEDINKAVLLSTINEKMKEAVNSVKNLRELSATTLDTIMPSVNDLQYDLENMNSNNLDLDLPSIILISDNDDIDYDTATMTKYHITSLLNNLKIANEALLATVTLIEEKDEVISQEIIAIENRSKRTAAIVVVIALTLALLLSILISSSIVRTIQTLSENVKVMSTGDFTVSFTHAGKDEIGTLVRDLDSLLGNLNQSIGQIQVVSRKNQIVCENLISIASESSSSAVEIEINSESIRNQFIRMDDMLENAGKEINNMAYSINNFHEQLGEQNYHVTETVSAITQMLASIDNISRITKRDLKAADELVEESINSKITLEDAFDKVLEITSSVSAIQEMAQVIANIASQTNVLAMNAAIEAAHAEEFGKGFAVVADEITKLSIASASSSSEIAQTIEKIVIKINEAGETREFASSAFNKTSIKIKEVAESISEIYSNVNEMQLGSNQILSAMENLNTTSNQLTTESARIDETSKNISITMNDLSRVSHEVISNIGEINSGIQVISKSAHDVSNHTKEMDLIGKNLDAAISLFKTKT